MAFDPPPALMHFCQKILAENFSSNLDYWKVFQDFPPDIIKGTILHLSPLTLESLTNELQRLSRKQSDSSGEEGRSDSEFTEGTQETSHNDFPKPLDWASLMSTLSTAWKFQYDKRWPASSPEATSSHVQNSICEDACQGEPDWQQLYWEAHLQSCLNEASKELLTPNSDRNIGNICLSSDLLNYIYGGTVENEATALSSLRANCVNFGHFARKLRLHFVVCSPGLVKFLIRARLHSITFCNVRIRSGERHLRGVCRLLTANLGTLRCLEFSRSMLCGDSLKKIGKAMGSRHQLQHLALMHTKIVDPPPPADFLQFLCAAGCLRSLKLWDNYLDEENVVVIIEIIMEYAENICLLQVVENELGEVFSELLLKAMNTEEPVLKQLRALDLRSNLLDSDAAENLEECLSRIPSLQQLDVSENPLGDDGIRLLIPYVSGTGTALEELSLASCEITATSAILMLDALADSHTAIRRLSIANNSLGWTVVPSLAKLLSTCNLESLDISEIDLRSEGCSDVLKETLIANTTLVQIDISKNRIGAPGAAMVASIVSSGGSRLSSINASANLLNVRSIRSITSKIRNSEVYEEATGRSMCLDLRDNPGSFLSKIRGHGELLGACTVLLSDFPIGPPRVLHDDDP